MTSGLGMHLKSHWLGQGLAVRPGVTAEQIRSFEASRGVLLPGDLRAYLEAVNGTGRYTEMDAELFCFWSLEEFIPLGEEHPDAACFEEPTAYFLFADHSINLPAYAIRLSADPSDANPIVAVYSDRRNYSSHGVAESFTAFVEEYLSQGIVL